MLQSDLLNGLTPPSSKGIADIQFWIFVGLKSLLALPCFKETFLQSTVFIWILWAIGAAIYVQGHSIHLAAALFKHPVQDFMTNHPEFMEQQTYASELTEIYSYMRDTWEHYSAHYMYASGAMWMSWVQIFFAFRDQVQVDLDVLSKVVFAIGSLIYGTISQQM